MNRKGAIGEQLSVFYFIFLMLMIGVGIVIGTSIFYGKGYDYRQTEADLLNYKIEKCILENDLDENFFKEENFFANCKLSKEVLTRNNLLKICDGFGENCFVNREAYVILGSNFNSCKLENKNSPKCSVKEIEKDGKRYVIISGSNQDSRREVA